MCLKRYFILGINIFHDLKAHTKLINYPSISDQQTIFFSGLVNIEQENLELDLNIDLHDIVVDSQYFIIIILHSRRHFLKYAKGLLIT